ncbi:hypothetical protein PAALTS15_17511 [Paenibacillus alvei TS-15]|uniref:Uncharacterized protein n=1 Tax=Paenibacillus alvei TS-15 TaxID=1117108 RepID=S9SJ87_PAEAL|nr:hypothetical protein [Paenibacillus alvei]EPY05877.1 hypothetical protein PAALTS15_17511 [Paenibacillus alvei TS-15]
MASQRTLPRSVEALYTLSETNRTVTILYYIDDYKVRVIGDFLGITVDAVGIRDCDLTGLTIDGVPVSVLLDSYRQGRQWNKNTFF